MIPRRRRLASTFAICAIVVLWFMVFAAFALLVTESVPDAMIAAGLICGSLWVHVVVHECGHLVAALVLRLPVVAVRISPFTGWRNEVAVLPDPDATALPLRLVLFFLTGPVANLVLAAALGIVGMSAGASVTSTVLLGAAFVGVLFGLFNLVPGISPRLDGNRLLFWLRAPAAGRAALRVASYQAEVRRTVRLLLGEDIGAADDDARRALAAYQQRWVAVGNAPPSADLVTDAERLSAMARNDNTDPMVAAAIGQVLTVQFGLLYLYAAVVHREPVPHQEIAEIAEMAEVAFRAQPDTLATRIAVGLANLLNERPERAHELLADAGPGVEPADLRDVALLLRAVAECCLGRNGLAGQAVEDAAGRCRQLAHVAAAIYEADPKPPMFSADVAARTPTG